MLNSAEPEIKMKKDMFCFEALRCCIHPVNNVKKSTAVGILHLFIGKISCSVELSMLVF